LGNTTRIQNELKETLHIITPDLATTAVIHNSNKIQNRDILCRLVLLNECH